MWAAALLRGSREVVIHGCVRDSSPYGHASIVLALGAAPAAAQTAPAAGTNGVEVSAGYQLLHIPDETFPFGMNFDVSAPVTPAIHAVGEFGFATDNQSQPGVGGNVRLYNLGAGPRWRFADVTTSAMRRPIEPYVQVLLGAVRTDADLVVNGAAVNAGDWAFMLQPGAGVTVPLAPRIGVLGQVDYRRAFFSPDSENEFRFMLGVRIVAW
jgi:outer membrane protein with beta-barrel domain